MNHSFNTTVAKEYGLEEAILLENIYFWCKKNESNGKLINGKPWTYNSVRAFNQLFDYISPSKITRALKNLETNGLIEVSNFNSNSYDRTKWYCVTDKAMTFFETKPSNVTQTPQEKVEKCSSENKKSISEKDNSICENSKWNCQNSQMNITDINTTIYILHLISREINKSDIIEQKALLSLLPEFFVPFFNNDISLTYPYINRILTTIQSNILCNISSIYIGEIFKKIIFYLFFDEEENIKEPINKKHFEICQGFCLYNMKLKSNKNQEVGIICLNILLNELDYSFLNQNNFVYYIWENITYFLDEPNFFPKNYLLKYLSDFISKFKIQFKPYVEIAIYKILEYIDDKDGNIRKSSLNILGLLISFYPKEIDLIKNLIMQLLLILNRDKDENIRIKSIYIYNKLKKQYDLYNPIKTKKKNKTNLYFYDSGNNKHFNQKTQNLNITGNESIVLHRRVLSINSSHSNLNVFNKGYKKKTLYTEPRSSKSDIGENSPIIIKQSKEKEDLKNNNNKISTRIC